MSVKSTVLIASLFLVWGLHAAQADFTPESPYAEEEWGTQDAKRDMQALLFDTQPSASFEKSTPQFRELFDTFTPLWKTLSDVAFQEKLGKALEKEIMGKTTMDLETLPVLSEQLTDAYNVEMLAKQLGFSPKASEERQLLENASWKEKVQNALDTLGSFNPYPDSGIGFYY